MEISVFHVKPGHSHDWDTWPRWSRMRMTRPGAAPLGGHVPIAYGTDGRQLHAAQPRHVHGRHRHALRRFKKFSGSMSAKRTNKKLDELGPRKSNRCHPARRCSRSTPRRAMSPKIGRKADPDSGSRSPRQRLHAKPPRLRKSPSWLPASSRTHQWLRLRDLRGRFCQRLGCRSFRAIQPPLRSSNHGIKRGVFPHDHLHPYAVAPLCGRQGLR